jgi:hypothetical protein
MFLILVFTQQINHTARYIYRNFDYEGTDMQLNTYVQLHLHDLPLNEPEDNPSQPAKICSEVKLLKMRLSHLFLEDVLTVARFSNSALKDSFAKGIPFSCSQAIISSFLQLCVKGFSRRTL